MLKKFLFTGLLVAVVAIGWPQVASLHSVAWDDPNEAVAAPVSTAAVTEQVVTGTGPEVREEFNQTYPFTANGRIAIENINGAVRINVGDRNEVKVNAVKRAYNRERLAQASIDVTATADALRIKTRYPDHHQNFESDEKGRHHNPASVDYTLTVPRAARLESVDLINGPVEIDGVVGDVNCSSINGRISAKGLMGSAKLSTINGELEAVFTRLTEAKTISLNSVNASISMMIPSSANAMVRASTVHGEITNDFGLDVKHGDYVGHELYGQIGNGGPRIKIGNVNGRIVIKRNLDGEKLSAAVSLLSQQDKDQWEKDKEKGYGRAYEELTEEQRKLVIEARRTAVETRRIERQVRSEASREAAREMRAAQVEIQRAQAQINREMQREVRREVRAQARAEGHATGVSSGGGVGGNFVTLRESKSFPVTGATRVNVVTFEGAVSVRGWDKAEVMYTAIKRAGDEQEAKQITVKGEQQGSSISIIATSPESYGSVSIELFVPRNVSLHVSSGDGQLSLDGVSGDLTLRTGDGAVEVANATGQLNLNTGDGPIKVGGFEGQLQARTGDGSVSLDGKFVALNVRTGSGSITLAIPVDSNFTIETDAEGVTNEGLSISEDLAPSQRVKRWKVGKGGKVFVISTGDGRILLRQK